MRTGRQGAQPHSQPCVTARPRALCPLQHDASIERTYDCFGLLGLGHNVDVGGDSTLTGDSHPLLGPELAPSLACIAPRALQARRWCQAIVAGADEPVQVGCELARHVPACPQAPHGPSRPQWAWGVMQRCRWHCCYHSPCHRSASVHSGESLRVQRASPYSRHPFSACICCSSAQYAMTSSWPVKLGNERTPVVSGMNSWTPSQLPWQARRAQSPCYMQRVAVGGFGEGMQTGMSGGFRGRRRDAGAQHSRLITSSRHQPSQWLSG